MLARNPVTTVLVLGIFVLVFYFGYAEGQSSQALGYLAAVWLGAFATDIVVIADPRSGGGFPIKWPVALELAIVLVCILLGAVYLIVRFGSRWAAIGVGGRLALLPVLMLFTFPVALAVVYLVFFRYKLADLGINLRYWYLPFLIGLVIGGIATWVAPGKSYWRQAFHEWGWWGFLFTGIISAGLSEEFTRMLVQTRLGRAFHNTGLGFFTATLLWACLHIPVNRSQNPHATLPHVVIHSLGIMPIGFLWGYITHRTRSLVPAVLSHGLNLWGLQNF